MRIRFYYYLLLGCCWCLKWDTFRSHPALQTLLANKIPALHINETCTYSEWIKFFIFSKLMFCSEVRGAFDKRRFTSNLSKGWKKFEIFAICSRNSRCRLAYFLHVFKNFSFNFQVHGLHYENINLFFITNKKYQQSSGCLSIYTSCNQKANKQKKNYKYLEGVYLSETSGGCPDLVTLYAIGNPFLPSFQCNRERMQHQPNKKN